MFVLLFFFFNDTATTEIYTLSLHDALPIFTLPTIRPAVVVVLTTIAIATLKVFDIVRTMTGGQFGTSVVANEFYSQSFRSNQAGLGAALAVLLFVLVIPIVAYNIRQMRA